MPINDTASSTAYRTARRPVLVFAALHAAHVSSSKHYGIEAHALAICTVSLALWYFCSSNNWRMTCCRLRNVLRMGCSWSARREDGAVRSARRDAGAVPSNGAPVVTFPWSTAAPACPTNAWYTTSVLWRP